MIEITLSNAFVFKNGRDLSRFAGVKIIVGLMWFILDRLLMEQGPTTLSEGGKWAR
jgi:hypothetical protein